MIDLSQWKAEIVRPALALLAPIPGIGPKLAAEWAVNQVTGTTKESAGCTYVRQIGGGPALGFYQMEPDTHDDIWKNFLGYQPAIAEVILHQINPYIVLASPGATTAMIGKASRMIWDARYATLMCRIDYWRSKLPAPANNAQALAQYHKNVYNTALGASVASEDVDYYRAAINA